MRCRICLKSKRNISSIFKWDKKLSFATMLITVADVKESFQIDPDNNNDVICIICQRKLRELYDFKILIEYADLKHNNCYGKKLKFNNIKEIEIDIYEDRKDNETKPIMTCHVNRTNLINLYGQDVINYNDTTIKKVCKNIKEVPETDEMIKQEIKYFNDDHLNDIADVCFQEVRVDNKTKHYKKKKKIKTKMNGKFDHNRAPKRLATTNVCIKPIYLEDFKLISTKGKTKSRKKKSANKKYTRKDICPYCGKVTGNIRSHSLLHTAERKFKCHKCNKSFYKESLLKGHLNRHILNPVFRCEHCVAAFSSKTTLIKHMAKHQDVRGYVCNICNKGFKWKSGLVRHTLIHNPNAKSVVCDICSMSFISKYGLRHHMRVHTGERPFMCEICLQPYSYKHDFNRHCFKKHGVFLKRRSVRVMNEEVLVREKALLKELVLRMQSLKDGEFSNPFEGPQAAQAFEMAVKQLQLSGQMPVNYFV